jgi:ATP-binding protein involved in chromosome partitioning
MTTEEDVRAALASVIDPEIGANLIELNMIKRIAISEDEVAIDLVLTAPGCPLANYIVEGARQSVVAIPGVKNVEVKVLDQPWEPPDDGNGSWGV